MSLFQQAMSRCDDCDAKDKPLAWFGPNIRICTACRAKREPPAPPAMENGE